MQVKSKKRTFKQANLNDFGFDSLERMRIRGHLSDYQWLLNNYPYPAKVKRVPKQARKAKKEKKLNRMLDATRKKIIEMRFGKYEEYYKDLEPIRIKYSYAEIGRILFLRL